MQLLLVLFCVLGGCLGLVTLINLWMLPSLGTLPLPEKEQWPSLTIIAPARNEAEFLEVAMERRLNSGYPNAEVLLVNDRSTDETGEIAERIAAKYERFQVLPIKELPTGWLGKLYGLHRGVQQASGEWILFSDADVLIEPGTLQRAIAYCEARQLDFLTAMPTMLPAGFWINALHAVFLRVLYAACWVQGVENSKLSYGLGVGAFSLIRRSALLASPGLEAIRLEVADDLMLGRMLKRSGARCSICNGAGAVSVSIYPRVKDFVAGAEKNAWAVSAQFRFWQGMISALALLLLDLAPWLLIAFGTHDFFWIGLGTALWTLLVSFVALAANRRPVGGALFYPLGSLLFFFAAVRGTWLGWRNGGLQWRETFYPTELFRTFRKAPKD